MRYIKNNRKIGPIEYIFTRIEACLMKIFEILRPVSLRPTGQPIVQVDFISSRSRYCIHSRLTYHMSISVVKN